MATQWLTLLPDTNSKCARVSCDDRALAPSCWRPRLHSVRVTARSLREGRWACTGGRTCECPALAEHARDLSEIARGEADCFETGLKEGVGSSSCQSGSPVLWAATSMASSGHAGPVSKAGGNTRSGAGEERRLHWRDQTEPPGERPADAQTLNMPRRPATCLRGPGGVRLVTDGTTETQGLLPA